MHTPRRLLVVLGVVVALVAVAGVAYAAAPRATVPTINGCVNKQTGVLRVATPTRGCITRPGLLEEFAVAWSLIGATAPGTTPGTGGAQPASVERRTVRETVTGSKTVKSSCEATETVVTGSWSAEGAYGYSLNDTGERDNGFQVAISPGFVPGGGTPAPVPVTVTAVCLKIA